MLVVMSMNGYEPEVAEVAEQGEERRYADLSLHLLARPELPVARAEKGLVIPLALAGADVDVFLDEMDGYQH